MFNLIPLCNNTAYLTKLGYMTLVKVVEIKLISLPICDHQIGRDTDAVGETTRLLQDVPGVQARECQVLRNIWLCPGWTTIHGTTIQRLDKVPTARARFLATAMYISIPTHHIKYSLCRIGFINRLTQF